MWRRHGPEVEQTFSSSGCETYIMFYVCVICAYLHIMHRFITDRNIPYGFFSCRRCKCLNKNGRSLFPNQLGLHRKSVFRLETHKDYRCVFFRVYFNISLFVVCVCDKRHHWLQFSNRIVQNREQNFNISLSSRKLHYALEERKDEIRFPR